MKLTICVPVRNGEKWVLKALQSIPKRQDIEVIVIDDASEDGTYGLVETYKKYAGKNIRLYRNDLQGYPCSCINLALELMNGEYFTQLDSDDWYETENFLELFNMDRKEDIIFFHNQINDGTIWKPESMGGLVDHVCFYKRSVIGDIRHGYQTWGSGWNFHMKIMSQKPSCYYFKKVVYHYNYPREGSNYDLGKKGLI